MNGNPPGRPDDDADEGLDPALARLFDATATRATPEAADAFVSSVLLRIQRAQRLRLLGQAGGLAILLVLCAFVAPYVARQTLTLAGLLTEELPTTGTALISPIGWVCAALITWLIARRARTH
jgi:hypothetical protein